jgi:beta-glucosidase
MPELPSQLRTSHSFWWAAGIEDTFITTPHPQTRRTLDEYELTGHYERWREDLNLLASLGVSAARYGVPWHRIQPQAFRWDWSFADETLGYLLSRGIDPQVDLVHYGLPAWIEEAYLNPDYPSYVAEYASRFAERFRGRIMWYTPLNEPRITAWYCGRLGWWPPFRRSWQGFVTSLLSICRGIIATANALSHIDPEIVVYHVDATDLYEADDATLAGEVEHRQAIVFLPIDLISGRVDENHALWSWLIVHGATVKELDAFRAEALEIPVIGLNLYPMFTRKRLLRDENGRHRIRTPYGDAEMLKRLSKLYHRRYGSKLIISETASIGSVVRRKAWLEESVRAVADLRRCGIPLIGYTWWPLFALVAWAYRQGSRPVSDYFVQMGLWDLDADCNRVSTPLVDAYRCLVERGIEAVDHLSPAMQGAS